MTLISHYFFSNQIQMKFFTSQVIFSHIWLGFQFSLFHHGDCKEITGSMVPYCVRMCCRCFWCVANASHSDQPFGLGSHCVLTLVLHACCLSQQEGHKLRLDYMVPLMYFQVDEWLILCLNVSVFMYMFNRIEAGGMGMLQIDFQWFPEDSEGALNFCFLIWLFCCCIFLFNLSPQL